MGKKSIAIPVVLAALAAAVWLAAINKQRSVTKDYEPVPVLVARQDLPADTVLSDELVETLTVPRRYVQQGAYEVLSMSDVKLVDGQVSLVRIPKGNQILASCLQPPSAKVAAGDKLPPSQQHYLEGVKYFQNSNYDKARVEWQTARKLDPANAEAAAGLKRIEMILAGGK